MKRNFLELLAEFVSCGPRPAPPSWWKEPKAFRKWKKAWAAERQGQGGSPIVHYGKSLVLSAVLALSCSCSTFTSSQTVERDGETVTTTIRARTFFDGRSELAKLRTTQTEKTQGVTLGALGQETSATNVVELFDRVVRAAVAGAVSAAK